MDLDKGLLKLIAKKDQKAFESLYKKFSSKVFNTALSYTKNNNNAEEVTQDVFIKIYDNAHKFKGNSSVETWIYRITINTSINCINKLKKHHSIGLFENGLNTKDFKHPGIILEKKEEALALFEAIEYLPESQKTAFILSFIENLPRQQVADVMEMSLKAVESLLQRAKKKLRVYLEKKFDERRK